MNRSVCAAALAALFMLAPAPPQARKNSKEFTYPVNVVWSTAVRLIRADLGYPIREKDKDSGFILFAYPGRGKVKEFGGAMEILTFVNDEGYRMIKVQLDIGGQPSFIELQILDKLERKLLDEQGSPPRAIQVRKKEKKKKKPDKPKPDKPGKPGSASGNK